MSQSYYFPLLFLTPDFEGDSVENGSVSIHRRKWGISVFDFNWMFLHHKLHLPHELMEVFMRRVNLQLRVTGCEDHEAAKRIASSVRLGLCAAGMTPCVCPFISSNSIDDFAGLNDRDNPHPMKNVHEGLREGFTSKQGTIEVWPWELSLQCVVTSSQAMSASTSRIVEGFDIGAKWLDVVAKMPSLKVIEDAANDAPKLGNLDQSLLHVWTALEALFPAISQEVSFRLSLYLAQLIGPRHQRLAVYERVKKAYNVRSKVAHGSKRGITRDEWYESWSLLMSAVTAISSRGAMPTEAHLLTEILDGDVG